MSDRHGGSASAAIVHSSIATGRTASIDTAAAEAASGVLAVLTHRNAPRTSPAPGGHPLQDENVRYAGQPVAVVVAETRDQAVHAGTLVGVEYEEAQPPAAADAAIAEAPVRIERTYSAPDRTWNPIEPHATTAVWDGDGRLTIYATTQHVAGTRKLVSTALGVPPVNVVVVSRLLGGRLGRAAWLRPHGLLAALAAKVVNRPVRVEGHCAAASHAIALGADGDGKLTGVRHAPAAGEALTHFALESALDELAHATGVDPVALRLLNGDLDRGTGRPLSTDALRAGLAEGAARFGWDERAHEPGSTRDGSDLVGRGVAGAVEGRGFAAVFAEVRVDVELGGLRLSRLLGVHDGGRAVSLGTARSQTIRGLASGAGQALVPSPSRYEVDVLFVGEPDEGAQPLGARDFGELTAMAVAPAIANALHDATGERVRDLPITPEKLP